jgi:hypothetical protein
MGDYLACFTQSDVSGKIPTQLNDDLAYRIGRSFAQNRKASVVAVGHDLRPTSESLCHSLSRGLMDGGTHVINIGDASHGELSFAVQHLNTDGGICVAGDNHPKEINGMRFYNAAGHSLQQPSELLLIEKTACNQRYTYCSKPGGYRKTSVRHSWLASLINTSGTGNPEPIHLFCIGQHPLIINLIDSLGALLPITIEHATAEYTEAWQNSGNLKDIPDADFVLILDSYQTQNRLIQCLPPYFQESSNTSDCFELSSADDTIKKMIQLMQQAGTQEHRTGNIRQKI